MARGKERNQFVEWIGILLIIVGGFFLATLPILIVNSSCIFFYFCTIGYSVNLFALFVPLAFVMVGIVLLIRA